jgi:RNA polymerase sigma-70 factor, ECF subfamily
MSMMQGAVGVIAARTGLVQETDERGLIRAAQKGDPEAFEQLVRAYDHGVLRMALNLLRSPEDARDVYQEAFLRVFRSLPSFRFDCAFQTWLYRIVTNVCFDFLRKRKVRREEPSEIETSERSICVFDTLEQEGAEGDPERNYRNNQLSRRIELALDDLTPRERAVFELRHYQGLRLRTIGEMLGTSEEAAKNCLFRATQKMRAQLGEFL